MFLTYLRRELRQRARQAVLIALGLAVGIGLVLTVTSASAGVKTAQSKVLDSLYGVGTDITVTKTATPGSGGGPTVKFGGGSGSSSHAHDSFSKSSLTSFGYRAVPASDVATIAKLAHVSSASGALVLTETSVSGNLSASAGSGTQGSFSTSTTTVDGVSSGSSGVLSSATIVSGHSLPSGSSADVAVISQDYATSAGLKVGSTVTVAGTKFTVVGIESGSSADIYIPLAKAQSLSGMKNDVNTIYVSADSSANISTVSKEISAAVPGSTVTTSASLAKEVTGSLSSASSLINSLGKWLSIAVLVAAFGLAGLMTMSAVSRRVREFGTLKAMGWPSGRVVRQVLGESLAIGIIGGVAGVLLGFAGAEIINAVAPTLTASGAGSAASGTGAGAGTGAAGGFGGRLTNAASDVTVHLTATMTLGAIALAVALAIAGGLIAGALGGWRATRLRPAAAFASVT
jgi:putative ABC transport system permease protein